MLPTEARTAPDVMLLLGDSILHTHQLPTSKNIGNQFSLGMERNLQTTDQPVVLRQTFFD